MEVSKVPQADPSASRTGTPAGPIAGTATATESDLPAAIPVSGIDFADIRPLDLAAALQILMAEVQAGLDVSLAGSSASDAAAQRPIAQNALPQTPTQASREVLDLFLRALPEDASDAPAWTAAVIQLETTVQSSIDRALGVIAAWRDVPPPIVEAVRETRMLFSEALSDEPQVPVWLRPEWLGLGPRYQGFRRRRRNARRRLTDPDYPLMDLDETEDFHR